MEFEFNGFNIVDAVVAGILLISGMLAFSRGFTREALAIGGWVLAGAAALYLAPMAEPLLHEIPSVGEWLARQCSLSKLAAFAVVFAVGLIVLSIFTPLFSSAIQDSALGPIDKGLGFLFGVARGLVLVAVAYLVYSQIIPPADRMPLVEEARAIGLIAEASATITENLPETFPAWLAEPINALMEECGGIPALTPDAPAGESSAT